MLRLAVIALLVLSGCSSPPPPQRPRRVRSLRAPARAVSRCRRAFRDVAAASDTSTAVRGLLEDCAALHTARSCREAFHIAADAPPETRLPILAAGCRRGYCPRLSDPRPALCEADVATMQPDEIATAWVELERRVLERRLGRVGSAFAEAFGRLAATIVVPVVAEPAAAPAGRTVTLVLGRQGDLLFVERQGEPTTRASVPTGGGAAAVETVVRPLVAGVDRVVISADRSLPHATVVLVLDAVRAAGVTRFAISVQPED